MKAQKAQGKTTLAELDELVLEYMRARDWDNIAPRALAISMALEANELLEHFQWEETPVGDKEALADELADVLVYAFNFAQIMNIDIAEAIKRKLEKSAKKYPAELFKGKAGADRRQAWLEAKKNHRKTSL